MTRSISVAILSALVLTACASRSEDIAAAYVSPLNYQSLSCAQLSEEATRVSSRAAQAVGAQNQRASNDAVATGVSLILFWPAVFFIRGDSASAAEVSRLKGEMEAIEQVSVRKNCGIVFNRT